MSGSAARRVARDGATILLGSLVLVGLGTGAALHVQARTALDQALLVAAHGHLHPEAEDEWEAEHSRSPVDTWVARREDPRLPEGAVDDVLQGERATYMDARDRRVLLLPVELEHDDEDRHAVVAASAPRVTLARSIGGFALAYGGFAAVVAAVASIALVRSVRASFAPIDRARAEAEGVLGLGQGTRLTTDGPDEVRSLLLAVNALLDRLDDAGAAQARFAAEAAHELRTPVAAMLGELDVTLRRERTAAELRDALVSTREEAERLRRIVQALTAFVRLDAGEAGRGREVAHAGEVAARAFAAERAGLDAAGCTVRVVVVDDPSVEANLALLELALANLLRNVARHAPGASVELRIAALGDTAAFEVHDSGPGVPESEREAMFVRFARSGRSRRDDSAGLGLGLPFAREVARRHGGDCVLAASPLGGTLVRLTLPVARE
ncbi:MAG: HAMP domain-containing sensor histidine kinase [Pseudomonadota bacterium]|nr:HAMP domain-containing sensor histidine kinase [Pseudomonadota bacterium]